MTRLLLRVVLALAVIVGVVPQAFAQDPDDAVLRPAEPDFAVMSLPSALRLPARGSAFRFTHRFAMPLNNTPRGEVFSRLFGIDGSAFVGLEYRYGLVRNLQVGLHHSTDNRTWSFFGEYGVLRQTDQLPVDITALVAVDIPRVTLPGAPAERQASPSIAILVSRTFGDRAALYVEPIAVSNVYNRFAPASTGEEALVLGIGGRLRVLQTVSLVAEVAPRVAGFKGNTNHAGFGIEKRAGGHIFQLNFSNSFASLMSQLAQGGEPANNWHLGFNITRKFY